ncbi:MULTISPECIES: Hsp70 family protein [unclassified Dyella]|uniref:Hsp70 family protein n=1 Tax=unclassified Dyella TaxID=2634549 RepID=UPI000C852148|nr:MULTISPECIES: Hsp70 family protein [unclassified Dyella]MDR3447780.1 Hsp70 family protein [Dyella sp.]PMQ05441.1 Chaperone protein DnaK [Dyella sp. AD56]
MHIGIDFGTSYSAAAAIIDGELTLVRFGEAEQFRTAVYFPELVPDPSDFELTPELEAQLETHIRSARTELRRQQAAGMTVSRTDEELRRDALRVVRRQWMEEQARAATTTVASFQHALFGEEAVEGYLESGGGNLIESPKSMFGFRLDPQVRKVIVHIATHILEHIRLTASRQFGEPVRGAVIGRPVEFRSSMGAAGSDQAIEILREAATTAGFDEVSFLEEPAAAAMHYHKSLDERQHALIVDIGGGTTDVTHAELGGNVMPLVARNWGLPKGGTDLDVGVSLHSFMPLMGKDIVRVPQHQFVEAASVYNLPKQREFRKQNYRLVAAPYGPRLRALQELGATTRLNQAAERTKIMLSGATEHRARLDFIEPGLGVDATHDDLNSAIEPFLTLLERTLTTVRGDLTALPASVFLTGGTSRSPQVKARVQACFPEIPLVHGDPSLGVVSGLAVAANEVVP